jgi:hypothetical protein
MTGPVAVPLSLAVVDGVDVDAVATAVRACPAVEDLDGGRWGEVATYLPGRRVPGVRVAADAVLVQVRGRWGVPAVEVATRIRRILAALVAGRRVDVVLADLGDPPVALRAADAAIETVDAAIETPADPAGPGAVEKDAWTSSGQASAVSSSARTTPTAAAIRRRSSPA